MKISFFGATSTVTGSKYLLECCNKKYLIDCGLFQGRKDLRLRNREPFPVDPRTIDAVILTHAHIDHSGYIPLLIKQGFIGPIFCSHATRELSEILLLDAGRIQEEDTRRANRYGYSKHKPALPLFTEEDAFNSLKYFRCVDLDAPHKLAGDLTFNLQHSGHILGSTFVTLKDKKTSVVFSGDIGRLQDPVMKPPVQIEHADYLILESTYGDRKHPDVDTLAQLEKIINQTIARGGTIVIPSFAVGRAQLILYYLYKLKESGRLYHHIPIYLDSPMAQNATQLWCSYAPQHKLSESETQQVCSAADYVRTTEESKNLNSSPFPSIIISASGMLEAGRVLHHLERYAPDEKNTILLVGYQADGTRGDRLLRGEKEVKVHGQMVPIRARIEYVETLSSHADYEEILTWLKGFKSPPKQVFLTHGEKNAASALKSRIEKELHWKVTIPDYLESFNL